MLSGERFCQQNSTLSILEVTAALRYVHNSQRLKFVPEIMALLFFATGALLRLKSKSRPRVAPGSDPPDHFASPKPVRTARLSNLPRPQWRGFSLGTACAGISGMDTDAKPPLKFDDLIEIAARGLERARRANISADRAIADLVLRDLYGAGVRFVRKAPER